MRVSAVIEQIAHILTPESHGIHTAVACFPFTETVIPEISDEFGMNYGISHQGGQNKGILVRHQFLKFTFCVPDKVQTWAACLTGSLCVISTLLSLMTLRASSVS